MASVHPKPDEIQQLRSAMEPHLSTCCAAAMLRATLTWREQFQPHNISWAEIEHNASTGRVELLDSTDSLGRSVLPSLLCSAVREMLIISAAYSTYTELLDFMSKAVNSPCITWYTCG